MTSGARCVPSRRLDLISGSLMIFLKFQRCFVQYGAYFALNIIIYKIVLMVYNIEKYKWKDWYL